MTTTQSDSAAELLSAVGAIRDLIRSSAAEAEQMRTAPERLWKAFEGAGLYSIKNPPEIGGVGADPMVQMDVIEQVAYEDASAGWLLMIGMGVESLISGWINDEALSEIAPRGRMPRTSMAMAGAGGVAIAEGDGYRVTGEWRLATGVRHAEWVAAGARVGDRSGPLRLFLLPASEIEIIDDWHVSGLAGTGSNGFRIPGVMVPATRVWDPMTPALRGGPELRMGLPAIASNEHVAFAAGVARRVLDEVISFAPEKVRGVVAPVPVADRAVFLSELGWHHTQLAAARSLAYERYRAAWADTLDGKVLTTEQQLGLRVSAVHINRVAHDLAHAMFAYTGAEGLALENPIGRGLRDMTAGLQHAMCSNLVWEMQGRVMMGDTSIIPMT